jgi:hypothetical protein
MGRVKTPQEDVSDRFGAEELGGLVEKRGGRQGDRLGDSQAVDDPSVQPGGWG